MFRIIIYLKSTMTFDSFNIFHNMENINNNRVINKIYDFCCLELSIYRDVLFYTTLVKFLFEKLAKISVNIDFKVFVPLSYGENTKYIELIKNKGMELLGNRFIPLFNFMKFEEYIKLLSSVDIVIMNHYRQQAVGNLRFLLAKGKKVYLNEINPLYHYFKSEGIFLSNINECNFDVDFFIDYSNEIKLNNQEHIEKLFSNENILKYMNILFG